jgi:hypothetical protein
MAPRRAYKSIANPQQRWDGHANAAAAPPCARCARAGPARQQAADRRDPFIGAIFIVTLVLYGFNNQRDETGGQPSAVAAPATPQPEPGQQSNLAQGQQGQRQQGQAQPSSQQPSAPSKPSGPNSSTIVGQGGNGQGNNGGNANASKNGKPAPANASSNGNQ